jgi:hypothetical protein
LKAAGTVGLVVGGGNVFGQATDTKQAARKVKLGVIGIGGRGRWIAQLFKEHVERAVQACLFEEVLLDICRHCFGITFGLVRLAVVKYIIWTIAI